MDRGDEALIHDEWAVSQITSAADIAEVFSTQCYFGCEGDDPLNTPAAGTKGARSL